MSEKRCPTKGRVRGSGGDVKHPTNRWHRKKWLRRGWGRPWDTYFGSRRAGPGSRSVRRRGPLSDMFCTVRILDAFFLCSCMRPARLLLC